MKFKESETVELKPLLSQLERTLKTVCAFLNHKGGIIYFGISDKGDVIGQIATDSNFKKISQQIGSRIKPTVVPVIEEIEVEGLSVIKVTIEKYNKELNYFDAVPYTQSGTETIAMPPDKVKRSILNCAKFKWDRKICEDSSFEDIDIEKVEKYLQSREKMRNIPAKINMPLKDFLSNIKAVSGDKPTNAGILFFGKDPLKSLHHAQLRLARIKGNEIFNTILDRWNCDGTLWDIVLEAEDFIKRNIRYMGLRTDKFQRIDKYEYPIKALKEAIINGLIHRDYQSMADVRVFIFDDRVEIVSPGSFPDGVTPQTPIHKPVNSILSSYMYDIGLIEKYGSGIYLENKLCRMNGNEKPIYNLADIETKVIFKSQVRTISIDDIGKKFDLNERQNKAIEYINRIGTITNKEYRQLFPGINEKTVFRDLKSLVERGILIQKGEKKGRYYQLIGHNIGHNIGHKNDPVNDTIKGN